MVPLSRAFLAVYPPEPVLDAVEAGLRATARVEALRWLSRDQWHLTVRFCGRVPDGDALVDAVSRACAGLPPVTGLELAGAGAFPSARRGSVLWLGVVPGAAADGLGVLAAAAESACVGVGLAPDDREFRPHLTLARASRARDLRPLVDAWGHDPVGPPWGVDHVRLMRSDTRSTGAVHSEVARIPLTGRTG